MEPRKNRQSETVREVSSRYQRETVHKTSQIKRKQDSSKRASLTSSSQLFHQIQGNGSSTDRHLKTNSGRIQQPYAPWHHESTLIT